jgi:uncharacterized protein YceK
MGSSGGTILLAGLSLLMAGCTSPYMADISTDHWTVSPANEVYKDTSATIWAPGRVDRMGLPDNGYLSIFCSAQPQELALIVATAAPTSGSGSDRFVTLAFDGGSPTREAWSDSGHEFSTFAENAGFDDVVAQLRTHRSVEIDASDFTGVIWRATFTLNGASAAIDQVYKACGKATG